MSELTPEERALLEAAETETEERPKKGARGKNAGGAGEASARGPHTPVQHVDDGWANLPIQMRG